jgi:hypothetical protein
LAKRTKNYIDKEQFCTLIMKYKSGDYTKQEEKELGEMILLLVNHIAMRPNFCNYTYLDEMKSNAYFLIWKGLKNFNIERSNNAFCYFTTVTMNAFIFIINKENAIHEKNKAYLETKLAQMESKEERYAKKRFSSDIKPNNSNY